MQSRIACVMRSARGVTAIGDWPFLVGDGDGGMDAAAPLVRRHNDREVSGPDGPLADGVGRLAFRIPVAIPPGTAAEPVVPADRGRYRPGEEDVRADVVGRDERRVFGDRTPLHQRA